MEPNNTISPYNFTVLGISRSFMLTILTCLIVASNTLLLVILPRVKAINNQTKIFMRSLAIADIGHGVFLAFPKIASLFIGFWPYGNFSCILYFFGKIILFYGEQFSFIGISVDRFIAVTKPLRYQSMLTINRCRTIVLSYWMTAASIALFSAINRYQKDLLYTSYSPEEGACVLEFGRETIQTGSYIIGVFILTVGPVLAVTGMSLRIVQITVRHVRQVNQEPGPGDARHDNQNLHQSRQEIKVTLTMLVTTGAYVVAWLPVIFNSIANFFTNDKYVSTFLWVTQDLLFFSNCFWNAIIYSFRLSAFRKEVKQLLGFEPDRNDQEFNQFPTQSPTPSALRAELSRVQFLSASEGRLSMG